MTQFIPFSRDQAFLLPPDPKDWLPADDLAHLAVAAVERMPLGAFAVRGLLPICYLERFHIIRGYPEFAR